MASKVVLLVVDSTAVSPQVNSNFTASSTAVPAKTLTTVKESKSKITLVVPSSTQTVVNSNASATAVMPKLITTFVDSKSRMTLVIPKTTPTGVNSSVLPSALMPKPITTFVDSKSRLTLVLPKTNVRNPKPRLTLVVPNTTPSCEARSGYTAMMPKTGATVLDPKSISASINFKPKFRKVNSNTTVATCMSVVDSKPRSLAVHSKSKPAALGSKSRSSPKKFKFKGSSKILNSGSKDIVSRSAEVKTPADSRPTASLEKSEEMNTSLPSKQVNRKIRTKNCQCDCCGKMFKFLCHLEEHKRTHTREQPFQCEVCGLKFSFSSNMIRHMKICKNSGEKPYKCDVCGKTFAQKRYLHRHTNSHDEKPQSRPGLYRKYYYPPRYRKCDVCFKTVTNLTQHGRIHLGYKPYICEVCGAKFCQPGGLTLHKRKHTGEKPYECKNCGKRFYGMSGLTIHTRTHTGEKPYHCHVCGKRFTQHQHRSRHMRLLHKNA